MLLPVHNFGACVVVQVCGLPNWRGCERLIEEISAASRTPWNVVYIDEPAPLATSSELTRDSRACVHVTSDPALAARLRGTASVAFWIDDAVRALPEEAAGFTSDEPCVVFCDHRADLRSPWRPWGAWLW